MSKTAAPAAAEAGWLAGRGRHSPLFTPSPYIYILRGSMSLYCHIYHLLDDDATACHLLGVCHLRGLPPAEVCHMLMCDAPSAPPAAPSTPSASPAQVGRGLLTPPSPPAALPAPTAAACAHSLRNCGQRASTLLQGGASSSTTADRAEDTVRILLHRLPVRPVRRELLRRPDHARPFCRAWLPIRSHRSRGAAQAAAPVQAAGPHAVHAGLRRQVQRHLALH